MGRKVRIHMCVECGYEITVCLPGTTIPVENDVQASVLDNLEQGQYIVSLNEKTISDINDLDAYVYSFTMDPLQGGEIEFCELED